MWSLLTIPALISSAIKRAVLASGLWVETTVRFASLYCTFTPLNSIFGPMKAPTFLPLHQEPNYLREPLLIFLFSPNCNKIEKTVNASLLHFTVSRHAERNLTGPIKKSAKSSSSGSPANGYSQDTTTRCPSIVA
jgi:hypothetical protein